MFRSLVILLTVFFNVPSWGAVLYSQDWEGATAVTSRTGILNNGNCFAKPSSAYNSIELSTLYKSKNAQSIRMELNGLQPCPSGLPGLAWIAGQYRNELGYGDGQTGLDTDQNQIGHGDEVWFKASYYFPSNEGTQDAWWNSSSRTIFTQFMGGGNSATPEIHFMIGNNGKVDIEQTSSVAEVGETLVKRTDSGYFVKNAWNTIVARWKRTWESTGIIQIWVNGEQIVNRTNVSSAIRNKPYAFIKIGPYHGKTALNRTWVGYIDDVVIYDENETYASVTASADPPPGVRITSVNGGTALADNDTGLEALSNAAAVTSCYLNSNTAAVLPVNWNYTTNDRFLFNVGDVDQYTSAAATFNCYYKPYDTVIPLDLDDWTVSGTSEAAFVGNDFGYTTGMTVTSTGTATRAASYVTAQANWKTAVTGDDIQLTVDYKPTDPADQVYIGVTDKNHPTEADPRGEARGLAGDLAAATLNGGLASDFSIVNSVLGDGVYRADLFWTVGAGNTSTNPKYMLRFGVYDAVLDDGATIYNAVWRVNKTESVVSKEVTLSLTDALAPTVDNCTMPVTLDAETNTYTANISCTTTEVGGNAYAMLTTTNTNPDDSAVIAGTGASWSVAVNSANIEFEAGGLSYQDYWGWIVHKDAAGNNSNVAAVTFDDGVGANQVKKILFTAPDNDIWCYDDAEDTTAEFNGNLAIQVYDGDPRVMGDTPAPNKLAYDSSVAFTSGESTVGMIEENLEAGSINILSTGDQGYYVFYTDGLNCKGVAPIQLTVE